MTGEQTHQRVAGQVGGVLKHQRRLVRRLALQREQTLAHPGESAVRVERLRPQEGLRGEIEVLRGEVEEAEVAPDDGVLRRRREGEEGGGQLPARKTARQRERVRTDLRIDLEGHDEGVLA